MPYIVTTRSPIQSRADGGLDVSSRRAVATLDEVRKCHEPESWALGTDNPSISLPDGTVIEVERVSGYALAQRGEPFGLDPRLSDADKLPLIIAAYNAAQ